MPRNYDEMRAAEDRSFVIHGETFTITHGSKDLIGKLQELQNAFVADGRAEAPYSEIMEFAEKRLLLMVDDQNGASSRLQKLIDDGHAGYDEVVDASRWGFEVMTGVPTMPPEPSPSGRGKTGASQKAG